MDKKEVNVEKSAEIKNFWNILADMYEDHAENVTLQSSMTLYSITKVKNAKKVCEVGVASGLASRMYIAELMPKGAAYFASDISDKMIQVFRQRFETSDFSQNPKLKVKYLESSDMYDCDKLVEEMGEDIERKIFVAEANNENLPYPDNYFDCYIANLSLMIVNDHRNQISEAYRVLQQGGIAGFTVWGRKENSKFFRFLPDILEKLELSKPVPGAKSQFDLNNQEVLVQDFKDAGFSFVKSYYSVTNTLFNSVEEFLEFFNFTGYKTLISQQSEEKQKLFYTTVHEEYETLFGQDTLAPLTWEILVVIVKK